MPRGRPHQTAEQARDETKYRLLGALVDHPQGLRFKDWAKAAKVNPDTVASWRPKLIGAGLVQKEGRFYKITEKVGVDELDKSSLLRLISESRCASYGGEGPMTAFAFPPVPVVLVPQVGNQIESSLMGFWLRYAADHQWIDARYLTGELPVEGLIEELRKKLPAGKQGLTFVMNYDKVRDRLDREYVSQIVNSFKNSEWGGVGERLVMESRALELLRERKRVELIDAAKYLEIDVEKAQRLLDGLVDWGVAMHLLELDEKGNPKVDAFGVNLRIASPKPFLKRTEVGSRKFYSCTDS